MTVVVVACRLFEIPPVSCCRGIFFGKTIHRHGANISAAVLHGEIASGTIPGAAGLTG